MLESFVMDFPAWRLEEDQPVRKVQNNMGLEMPNYVSLSPKAQKASTLNCRQHMPAAPEVESAASPSHHSVQRSLEALSLEGDKLASPKHTEAFTCHARPGAW
eukprot:TRINITY_DN78559_c0_g1_i1.p2 TRINITY_DN78559_c0_g1~~TRINITY_DN78559_c0_g1_i1.p2  ORF type:complete len:103 (+),score=20.46 TRINITY_DN78559_c0_g1_i1:36-344(+)